MMLRLFEVRMTKSSGRKDARCGLRVIRLTIFQTRTMRRSRDFPQDMLDESELMSICVTIAQTYGVFGSPRSLGKSNASGHVCCMLGQVRRVVRDVRGAVELEWLQG